VSISHGHGVTTGGADGTRTRESLQENQQLIAVGTPVTGRPRTDPGGRDSRTGLPPRVLDRKAGFRPRVKDARPGKVTALTRRVAVLPPLKEVAAKARKDYGNAYCGGQIEASLRKVLGA
jgi:hypothetical protein